MLPTLKFLAMTLATAAVLPCVIAYYAAALVVGRNRAFPGWSQAMSLLPGLTGTYLRRAFYRLVLPRCGQDACISFGTVFSHPTAAVGRKAYVGLYCSLGDVKLEDDVLIGSHVSIANGGRQHGIDRLDIPIREQPGVWPRITIGRDTWIGDQAIVLANVGRHCVIGAGAVVTKDIPDYAIALGNPARIVRYRNDLADEQVGDNGRVINGRHSPLTSCSSNGNGHGLRQTSSPCGSPAQAIGGDAS